MTKKSFPIFTDADFGSNSFIVNETGDGKHAIMNQGAQKKYPNIPLRAAYIDFIAQESVNALDHRPMKGLPTDFRLQKSLYDWDFETIKAQVGKQLSNTGYAFVYLLNDGTANDYGLHFGEAFSTKGRHRFKPDEVVVSNSYYDETINGEQYLGSVRFFKENGKVFFQVGSWYQDEFTSKANGKEQDTFEFVGLSEIPGRFIRNNQESNPDWFRVNDMLKVAEIYFNDIPGEKEWSKTLLAENSNFGEATNSNSTEATISNGGRSIQFDEYNSSVGLPVQIFSQGSPTLADAIGTYRFHLDEIFKLSFTNRDMQSTGTNKHNTEVSIFNQTASQYLSAKKRQREMDWARFFMDIVFPIVGISIDSLLKLEFDISDFERHKIERAQAEIDEIRARAQANTMTAQANMVSAEARATQASQPSNQKEENKKTFDKK